MNISNRVQRITEHTIKGRGDLLDWSKAAEALELVADSDSHFGAYDCRLDKVWGTWRAAALHFSASRKQAYEYRKKLFTVL